jgi:small conductance mechanosensitive channel
MQKQRLFSTLILFLLCVGPLCAQDEISSPPPSEEPAPTAQTTSEPEIPLDHLELLLTPLTKDELLVEAEGWRDLVQAKVQEITNEEIATRVKNQEIAEADAEPSISEAEEDKKKEEKEQVLEELTTLREQKAALLERLGAVLDAYEAKGGDPTEFRKYATAVSGIKVEVTDVSATWAAIKGWVTSKEGGIKLGLNILQFAGIMFAFLFLARVVGKVVRKATSMHAEMSDLLKRFLNNIVRRAVLLIGFLIALSTLGVNIGALLALIGGSAFIVGFALQDTLGNFAAGLMLLVYRPFDVGDAVEVGGVNGKVDKVSLVSTTIRTFDNKVVLVPNKQVWGEVITNATASDERRVDMIFGIGYDDDTEKAREILERIVTNHELVLDDPEPVIQLNELADSSVNFICRPWSKTADYWTVYWDVTKQVKAEFDANNISIPYPQQDIHIHQAPA